MATYGSARRRGLPRRPGGDPWPLAGDAPVDTVARADAADGAAADAGAAGESPNGQVASDAAVAAGSATPTAAAAASSDSGARATAGPDQGAAAPDVATETAATETAAAAPAAAAPAAAAPAAAGIRRGLPRTPGGEPWPPADAAAPMPAAPSASVAATTPAPAAPSAPATGGSADQGSLDQGAPAESAAPASAAAPPAPAPAAPAGAATVAAGDIAVRRGLPRTPGGEAWPPAEFVPRPATAAEASVAPEESVVPDTAATPVAAPPAEAPPAQPATAPEQPAAAASVAVATGPREPLPFTPTVWPGAAAQHRPAPTSEPVRVGPFTRGQWAGVVIVGGAALLFAAAMVVFAVRWFLSLEFMQEFLVAYPGEYHLPEGAPVGLPAWLGWQHFFNVFFMVLIIRTGLQIRTEKRPTAFWTSKRDRKKKTSLTIWLHQSLDILWLVNGAIFLVLLFTTGQWMRIVPTSWEVFPNALSAALQYVSLDWPTENGWVNYNSLQQLAYFATVFIAAPLAAVTGYRMSLMWPKGATGLNKAYPIEWARALHFPVMLYFVVFIFFHVVLVFATGALRNLNHMYAAQDVVNWTGFWIFAVSMLVVAAGWVAARPLVVAPIARLFGNVVSR